MTSVSSAAATAGSSGRSIALDGAGDAEGVPRGGDAWVGEAVAGEGPGPHAAFTRRRIPNNPAKALQLLGEAAGIDEAQIYVHFGPPGPYKPAYEQYGEALLANQRPAEALKAFEDSLRTYEERRRRFGAR